MILRIVFAFTFIMGLVMAFLAFVYENPIGTLIGILIVICSLCGKHLANKISHKEG